LRIQGDIVSHASFSYMMGRPMVARARVGTA
jgi:hypothetical protein